MKQDESETALIIKRSSLLIDEKQSTLINFSDISDYRKLKKQEQITMLLKTLNATVHHEMLAPLKANIQICNRLLKLVKCNKEAKKLAQVLFVSNQMLLVHANDMLDQRIIDSGKFVAHPTIGSPAETIKETVDLIS